MSANERPWVPATCRATDALRDMVSNLPEPRSGTHASACISHPTRRGESPIGGRPVETEMPGLEREDCMDTVRIEPTTIEAPTIDYLLVNVPLTDPTTPYHSIPYLVGAADAAGFHGHHCLDAN